VCAAMNFIAVIEVGRAPDSESLAPSDLNAKLTAELHHAPAKRHRTTLHSCASSCFLARSLPAALLHARAARDRSAALVPRCGVVCSVAPPHDERCDRRAMQSQKVCVTSCDP
jgi:hypothetical protein